MDTLNPQRDGGVLWGVGPAPRWGSVSPPWLVPKLNSLFASQLGEGTGYVSLFSGCGGLDLPFHLAGSHCLWANDIDRVACETFRHNIADVITSQDIREVDPTELGLGSVDLIIGGFPCQDFSVVWKRPGLDGARGSLYWEFRKFVDALKPKVFVAENVKGLLSANRGRAIQRITADFESANPGYKLFYRLYNFADYGVPQLRERVIIVGVRKDFATFFCHPEPTHGHGRLPHVTAGRALERIEATAPNNEKLPVRSRTVEILKRIGPGGNFQDIDQDDPYYVKGMISHVYRRIDPCKPAMTLIANGGGGTWGYHYPEPRPLTNRERARLQSFPDEFVFFGTHAEIRRQIGNAVPPEGAAHVAEQVLRLLKSPESVLTGSADSAHANLSFEDIEGFIAESCSTPTRP